MQEIFKLDCFIENYYKMCVAIIMADPVCIDGFLDRLATFRTYEIIFLCDMMDVVR